jgi:large subunit ribosomal protein L33
MANKKKDARGYVALECTECKEHRGVSKENYFVEKSRTNTPERLEISKYCPTCKKHTTHKEKK